MNFDFRITDLISSIVIRNSYLNAIDKKANRNCRAHGSG